jgi:serine O-acetyltransferase
MTLTELLDADWARLQELAGGRARRTFAKSFSPRFAPIALLRFAQVLHQRGWTRLAKLPSLVNFVVFGIEVPSRLEIGPGLVIMHTQGTILGAARIGSNVTIFQQVTLGAKIADFEYDLAKRPVVEDGVTITAGAKVLGHVTLGEGCVVGANAVVLQNVPAGAMAVGVPARIVTGKADVAT